MTTNIDLLFDNVELILSGKYRPRQQGITFTYAWMMSNDVWLAENNSILYVSDTLSSASYAQCIFLSLIQMIFKNYPQPIIKRPTANIIEVFNNQFLFTPTSTKKVCGYRFNKIYVDVEDINYYMTVDELDCYTQTVIGKRKKIHEHYRPHLSPNGIII